MGTIDDKMPRQDYAELTNVSKKEFGETYKKYGEAITNKSNSSDHKNCMCDWCYAVKTGYFPIQMIGV